MRYSPSTGTFYPVDIEYQSLPPDLINISQDDYTAALNRAPGQTLAVVDDALVIVDAPEPTQEEQLASMTEAVRVALQAAINTQAAILGFPSGGEGLKSFAGYPNAFREIAEEFGAWEATVWVQANAYKEEVLAGNQPMLTGLEAVDMMPAYPA